MTTKVIKGKEYELDLYFPTKRLASERAKHLDGRIHILTGRITETAVTKVSDKKYAVCGKERCEFLQQKRMVRQMEAL